MISRFIKGVFFILMVSLVALSSCADDDIDRTGPIPPPDPENPNADVLFEINMPQAMTPSTYALTPTQENDIKSIEILLFKTEAPNKGYTGKPYYCDKIEDAGGTNASMKQFSVSLPKGGVGQKFEIVILANSRDAVETYLATAAVGEAKDDVLALLTMENTDKWISKSDHPNYKPIPMWGEVSGGHAITENLKFSAQLMRILAKVDVAISSEAQRLFELHAVHLINLNTDGHLVPASGTLSGGVATAPSLVSGSTPSGRLTYLASDEAPGATALTSVIYVFEAIKTEADKMPIGTCVVIQGKYKGGSLENYYRLDFGSKGVDGSVSYLDILRNFTYNINVAKISGTGQSSLDDAIKYPSTNIVSELTAWDNAEFPVIVFDNKYSMGLSTDDIVSGHKPSVNNILKIITDYPFGWEMDPVIDYESGSGSGWLTITTPISGAVNTSSSVLFNLADNDYGTTRICYIVVSAGPLRHKLKVTQLPVLRVAKVV